MIARAPGRHALAFIFVTVLIDTIGFGIVIPVFPKLVMEINGGDISDAARIGGWLAFAYAAMQFLSGPFMGNLSDRFGRRPVLIASLLAFAIDYVIMGFAGSLALLFIGRLVAGFTGACYASAYAYLADVTPPEKRAHHFGIVGMAFGFGFIIGPALGGLLADLGVRVPFFAAAALAFANAIYGWLVLPESLPPEKRRPIDLRRANPVGALLQLRMLHPSVLALALALFVWQVAHQALQGTWAFYTIYRFGWTEAAVGLSLAAVGLAAAIVQGGVTGVVIPRLGERRTVVLGMCAGIAAYLIYGLTTVGWGMYVGIVVGALAGLAYPSLTAMMSQQVEENAQGELQGALSSLASLATIIGPPVMTQLFAAFTGAGAPVQLPGVAFLLASVLAAVALAMVLRAPRVGASAAAGT